jgi:hypothetical protein
MKQHLSGLIKENMEGIHNEEDLIKKIKSNLSHLHKKDADHNAKTFIKQYNNGTLKSGVIYNLIKQWKDEAKLSEVKALQKMAGITISEEENSDWLLDALLDEILEKANGDKFQEYDWTKEVLNDHGITEEFKIREFRKYAIDRNYHRIADACEDILGDKKLKP